MKWILICIALAGNPVDGSRELYIFNTKFQDVNQCKTYSMVNSDHITETVVPEIGPFAAFCVTERVFEEQIAPTLKEEKKEWI